METFEINLLKGQKKSKWGRIGGFVLFVWGCTLLILTIGGNHDYFQGVWTINSVWFIVMGLIYMYTSTGKDIRSIVGKAFLRITASEIVCKNTIFAREEVFQWSDMEAISHIGTKFKMHLRGGKTSVLHLKEVEYEDIQIIKKKIEETCKVKNIGYSG